jgi:hypothetical protein
MIESNGDKVSRDMSGRRLLLVRAVTAVCIVVTLGAAWIVHQERGVFWSRVDVQFLLPLSQDNPNALRDTSRSLVMTAGAVARAVDPSGGKAQVTSPLVTLASEGIRHGWSVTQPNDGSQFVAIFDQPIVQVEAVGSTPAEVRSEMADALGKVTNTLRAFERASQIAPNTAIRLLDSAAPPPMYYEGGSKLRAVLATLALGGLITAAARIVAGRWRRRPESATTAGAEPKLPASQNTSSQELVSVGY